MAGRMYLGNEMVTPAIVSGGVDSVNGQTGEVVLTASDVNALPDTTKYAKTLGLSMNQTTFVLSWQLYDQNGDPIGQVQTVDLPLESVVVNATYDATNKKIVLTLENGTTVDVPVGDLVEGLQSEITITNMLSSDLVDDTNKTHQFVTTQEKTTWNNKQNAISDLATIRSGAAKGATAVQPAAIANMQTTNNLVTEVDEYSTDTQYPSAKAVYNVQLDLEDQLDDEARVRTRMDNQLTDRINILGTIANTAINKVEKCVRTIDVAPIADYDLLNIPVQYKGTTTQDFVNGYFYKFTNPVYSSSANVQTGSFTVTVDTPTFVSKTSRAGTYSIINYGDGYWYSDGLGWVTLDSYGITITGDVNDFDEFTVDLSMTTTATRIDVQPAGVTYTAGTGIDITNNEISVTSPTLVNTSNNTNSLDILPASGSQTITGNNNVLIRSRQLSGSNMGVVGINALYGTIGSLSTCINGNNASGFNCLAIGSGAYVNENYSMALGAYAQCLGSSSIAIGYNANVGSGKNNTIQLGYGTNSEASTFCVGFNNVNYKLLDGTTGKIPDGRLPIATSVSSSSTNAEVVGAKLFYDTCGDIETLINAL